MSEVRDNAEKQRFELDVEGHTAFAEYNRAPGKIAFTHTEVPDALAGRGVASRLVQGALGAARAEGLKVVAKCPFVSGYILKHPEFKDLLG